MINDMKYEKPRVLIVDDSATSLDLASAALSDAGFEAHTLSSIFDLQSTMETVRPHVLVMDLFMPALRGDLALNVLVNTGLLIETRAADWRRFPHDLGRFDLVVASDVLYEKEHATLIASVLDRTMTGRATAIIADPGRLAAPEFVEQCKERGMPAAITDRVPFEEGEIRQTIDLYDVRRR